MPAPRYLYTFSCRINSGTEGTDALGFGSVSARTPVEAETKARALVAERLREHAPHIRPFITTMDVRFQRALQEGETVE